MWNIHDKSVIRLFWFWCWNFIDICCRSIRQIRVSYDVIRFYIGIKWEPLANWAWPVPTRVSGSNIKAQWCTTCNFCSTRSPEFIWITLLVPLIFSLAFIRVVLTICIVPTICLWNDRRTYNLYILHIWAQITINFSVNIVPVVVTWSERNNTRCFTEVYLSTVRIIEFPFHMQLVTSSFTIIAGSIPNCHSWVFMDSHYHTIIISRTLLRRISSNSFRNRSTTNRRILQRVLYCCGSTNLRMNHVVTICLVLDDSLSCWLTRISSSDDCIWLGRCPVSPLTVASAVQSFTNILISWCERTVFDEPVSLCQFNLSRCIWLIGKYEVLWCKLLQASFFTG